MATENVPDDYVAPCGCRFWCDIIDGVRTLLFEPCSPTCDVRDQALLMAAEQDKPVSTLDLS